MAIGQSVRDKILAAITAALNGTGKPCQAYRTRVDALQASELPAYVVRALDESIERKTGTTALRTLVVRVECHTAGDAPQDVALDPLLTFAVKALYADEPLAALIQGLGEERIQWNVEAAYEDQALAALDFQVVYKTGATDPTEQK